MSVTTSAIDRATMRDLYDDYSFFLDDEHHEQWLQLFTVDCDYRVMSRENVERGLPLATMRCDSRNMLADRLHAIRETQFFAQRVMRHFVSAVRIASVDGGRVHTTANFLVTETLADEPSVVHSVGQYRDELVMDDGVPRFATKVAVYDAPLVRTSLVMPL